MSPPTEIRRPLALSAARRRALSILHPAFPLAPAIFAHYMWPTSPSWTRSMRAGKGIRLKAGTFLACLERDGLARRCDKREGPARGYVLTYSGARAIGYESGIGSSLTGSGS